MGTEASFRPRIFLFGLTVVGTMGLVAVCLAVTIRHDLTLGLIVAASMRAAVSLATSMGGLLPLVFDRLKLDPALVSSPAIASIVDITTLCIYFAIAHLFFSL